MTIETTTVYRAYDGKEFTNQWQCLEYERDTLKSKILNDIECCKEIIGCPTFSDGDRSPDMSEFYWVRPKDEAEAKLISDFFAASKDFGYSGPVDGMWDKGKSLIGKWVCLEISEDNNIYYEKLDGGVEYVFKVLQKLGYSMYVTDDPENINSDPFGLWKGNENVHDNSN